jgi:Ca2+/Na+ antiporter
MSLVALSPIWRYSRIFSNYFPLRVKDTAIKRELPILFAVQITLSVMVLIDGKLSRLESIIILSLFVLYMLYIALETKKSSKIQIDAEGDIDTDGDGNNVTAPLVSDKKHALLKLWILSACLCLVCFSAGNLRWKAVLNR